VFTDAGAGLAEHGHGEGEGEGEGEGDHGAWRREERPREAITHRYLSFEQILTTVVLLAGMVASYTLLSAKVDGLTTAFAGLAGQEAIIAERLRLHELLPIHPVARVELDNLTRHTLHLEEGIHKLEETQHKP